MIPALRPYAYGQNLDLHIRQIAINQHQLSAYQFLLLKQVSEFRKQITDGSKKKKKSTHESKTTN